MNKLPGFSIVAGLASWADCSQPASRERNELHRMERLLSFGPSNNQAAPLLSSVEV